MSRSDRWIIVGGGASGLAAAFFLRQHGFDSEIVERDRTIGGRMGSVELGGRSLDFGGKNIGRQYKTFRQFAASLGAQSFEYFGLNSSQVVNGKIATFDATARWRTLFNLVRGLSAKDVVRFARLLWRVKSDEVNGYLGSEFSRTAGSRYDRFPVTRYFSQEFCRRIIRPMSVRMNGAEPDEIYMGNLASNVRMLLDTYEQFKHGMRPLFDSFQNQYKVRFNTTTESLLVKEGRVCGVRVRSADGFAEDLYGAGVILATPAPVAAGLTESVAPDLSRQLRSIAYYPVALIVAEYDRPIFSSKVRALIFDSNDVLSNAGAYGINDLNLVRYTFSGKASREYVSNAGDAESLLRMGEESLSRHIAVDPSWRKNFVMRRFNLGLCAYTPYHAKFLDSVDQERSKLPGLYLTGDYIRGASIEGCFRSAAACVTQLIQDQTQKAPVRAPALELQTQS